MRDERLVNKVCLFTFFPSDYEFSFSHTHTLTTHSPHTHTHTSSQLSKEIRSTAPFLIPFLKMTCAYFVLLLDKGSFPAAVVKCLPLLSLIWFVCLLGVADPVAHRYNRRVATALVWCCCGDFFLVWSDANEIFFFLGLGCFAVGHAVYSHAFGWTPFGFKEFVFICSLGVPAVGSES